MHVSIYDYINFYFFSKQTIIFAQEHFLSRKIIYFRDSTEESSLLFRERSEKLTRMHERYLALVTAE